MIKYECSDGSKVSQATIDKRKSDSYKNRYQGYPQVCHGCGAPATCSAHIIAQARCKQLRKTELIWSEENYFPSCYDCNKAIENPKGSEWKDLCNLDDCLTVIMKYDEELYSIFVNNDILRGDLQDKGDRPGGATKGMGMDTYQEEI